ncbi:hypothetical protein BDN67DRAFT_736798 [Paxillus ammoniavirescens]|nr:hypothetical protein BDN67DRAFT_736798 [Paxillus ammoniavirescens]
MIANIHWGDNKGARTQGRRGTHAVCLLLYQLSYSASTIRMALEPQARGPYQRQSHARLSHSICKLRFIKELQSERMFDAWCQCVSSGHVMGALDDYVLASLAFPKGRLGNNFNERPVTIPFVIKLVRPDGWTDKVGYVYRESFIWVLIRLAF